MLNSAAVSARAALLPWALPRPLWWAISPLQPEDPVSQAPPGQNGSIEARIPPSEQAAGDRDELVLAVLDGPGLSPSEDACVESLLRRLKGLWTVVSAVPPQCVHFRRLPFDAASSLLGAEPAAALVAARSGADMVWFQVAAGSPLLGCPLGRFAAPTAPEPGVLALLRGEMLILRPDPATRLQATDGVVLRGWR